MLHEYPVLFVSWRSPRTRLIYPVGRLTFDASTHRYEFVYLRSVSKAVEDGFALFPEFPRLESSYRSTRLFPLFANRVMPPSRPDYVAFLRSLGLRADSVNAMVLLARTGGRRETDQIELFPVPTLDPESGCYTAHWLLRAIQYMPRPITEERIARLVVGEKLFVMPDPQNPVDKHAIAVRTGDNVLLGYIPAYLTSDLRLLENECRELHVSVEQVNPPPAEAHHRLLCRVVSCWPDGFQPFQTPEFESLASSA